MNPRQRRGLLLIAIAALGLVVVFVLIAGYVSDVRREVDPKTELLALAKPVAAHQAITDDMVETVEMPERWVPPTAVREPGQLVGLVAGTDLKPDTLLQEDMLVAPPQLAPGQRELAILVDAETGVAGKIGPDSLVDVIATYPGGETKAAESRVVVPNARIIEVGQPRLKGGRGVQEQTADPAQIVPITFALTPEQALVVSYAESNATEVRLALLRPGSSEELTRRQQSYKREADPEPVQ
ncbi:MAG TPA: Flp pilus assembly protein CpaB [Solirubrobacteraceae bacterium]|nr:Flp pilus assembly protein CpaB [Solirubrobacteraceae bacterium]